MRDNKINKLLRALTVITVLITLSAKSCKDEAEEERRAEQARLDREFDTIQSDFHSDELSAEHLQAFEKRASQKLHDVADYITIYSDPGLEEAFRKQVMQMVDQNFLSDTIAANYQKDLSNDQNSNLKQFNLTTLQGAIQFEIDSVRIHKHLEKIGDNRYLGLLRFRQVSARPPSADPANRSTEHREIEMYALKTNKTFGQVSDTLWNVYLGAIRNISP
jgi:hypothetical protein